MPKITISTTVDSELHKIAKEKRISWAHAIEAGLNQLIKFQDGEHLNETNTRMNELAVENKRMARNITRLQSHLFELNAKLEELEEPSEVKAK